jgi:rRNA-processing protein FCF1
MLIAVDTNVLMDLAAQVEPVVDAVELVRRRIASVRLIVVPTVIQELRYIAKFGEADQDVPFFQLLTLELKASDVSVPAIASPREILRKFYG